MSFPTFRDMIEPLLRVLAEAPDGLSSRRAQDLVAERLQLSSEDRDRRVPGGTQVLFRHRTNWAHDRLKRAQLSLTPRRGVWQLTPKGLALVRAHAAPLADTELQELANVGRSVRIAALQPDLIRKGPLRAEHVDAHGDGKKELSA
jgi:restriction system protein